MRIKKKYLFVLFIITISYSCESQNVKLVNSASSADVLINEVNNPEHADLLVYKSLVRVPNYGNNGIWHYLNKQSRNYRAIKIYYTSYNRHNTINIHFVNHRYKAKWQNTEKKHLLEK